MRPDPIVQVAQRQSRGDSRKDYFRSAPEQQRRVLQHYADRVRDRLAGKYETAAVRHELLLAGCPSWLTGQVRDYLVRTADADSAHLRIKSTQYAAVASDTPVGHACRYCGSPATHMDHVWPRARGGDDHPNNLVPACTSCNTSKGSQSWLTARCPGCDGYRDPGDVETSSGRVFYACRCGTSWAMTWDLQRGVKVRRATPSHW